MKLEYKVLIHGRTVGAVLRRVAHWLWCALHVTFHRSSMLDIKALAREQRRRGGVAAMWGKVPAEESDEDFLAAVVESD